MSIPSYKRYGFPSEIIARAVWLYYLFALSFRDNEELLASRGVLVSYEAIRLWCGKFGSEYARRLRHRRRRVGRRWHLDEVFIRMNGTTHYLWRAVDQNGQIVDILVQARRDRAAAERFFQHLLKGTDTVPHTVVTDRLRSYSAALPRVLPGTKHKRGHWLKNRAGTGAADATLQVTPASAALPRYSRRGELPFPTSTSSAHGRSLPCPTPATLPHLEQSGSSSCS